MAAQDDPSSKFEFAAQDAKRRSKLLVKDTDLSSFWLLGELSTAKEELYIGFTE